VELPSKGQFYSADHPFYQQSTAEIKYMTAKEEDILTSRALLTQGVALDRLLSSVLINKNVDIDSLLLGDKNALLIGTRITGYGSEYNTNVTCPACTALGKFTFDLESSATVGSGEIPPDVTALPHGRFLIEKLPKTDASVEVRLLTGRDEKVLSQQLEASRKRNLGLSHLIEHMRSFICAVNQNSNPQFIGSFLENLPALDARHLRTTYTKLVPNITLEQYYNCVDCGHVTAMEVPLNADFFWPG